MPLENKTLVPPAKPLPLPLGNAILLLVNCWKFAYM